MAWLIFFTGVWYFCIRILGYHLEFVPGDLGDSRFINYLLEHGYCWLTGKTESFWSAPFMHPFADTIALSDSMIGTQLLYFLWRSFGFGVETSYQLWWLCVCTLNYWVSYWSFNKLFGKPLPSAILAWVFAFSIFNLGQLNYMQMIVRFPIAIAFYSGYRFISQFSIKYLSIFCLSIVYQFYCVQYTGCYLLYFSLLFILVHLLLTKQFKTRFHNYFNKKVATKSIGILLISAFLLMFLQLRYISMSNIVGLRLYKEVLPNIPQIQSYLLVNEASTIWFFLFKMALYGSGKWWIHPTFPGMLLLATLLVSIFYLAYKSIKRESFNPLLKTVIVVSTILFLLHLRIGDNLSLYGLIFKLPGINSIRVPNRFMHVELFLLLIIFGFFIQNFNRKLLIFILLLVYADNSFEACKVIRTSKQELMLRKELLKKQLLEKHVLEKKTFAIIDTTTSPFITHLDAMMVAQEIGVKTINGYSSYCPEAFGEYFDNCSEKGLHKWMTNQSLNAENILVVDKNTVE
jgi:hypothetical protein